MKPQLPTRQAILDRRTYEPPGEGRADKLRLDFNENTAGCSRAVQRALGKLTPKLLSMYPEYERGTRRLARHFQVKPEELLLTNGGDDALRLFFDAFVDAGSSAVICEPTFPMYRYWGEVAGAKIEVQRYGREMEFPVEGVLEALALRPRVLFLCNPNNPTGTLLEKSVIETILKAATHTAVVVDEAYAEFSGADRGAVDQPLSAAFRGANFFESRRACGPSAGCSDRVRRIARGAAPRHGALPRQRSRAGCSGSGRRGCQNDEALHQEHPAYACVV